MSSQLAGETRAKRESKRPTLRTRVGRVIVFVSAFLGIPGAVVAVLEYLDTRETIARESVPDVRGHWIVWNLVSDTTHDRYRGLRIGYRMFLKQTGSHVEGTAEKWWENGEEVRGAAHTPVQLQGNVRDGALQLVFVEQGTERETRGQYIWLPTADARLWTGRFESTAALSSGPSQMLRPE